MTTAKLSNLFKKEAPGLTPLAVAVFMIIASKVQLSFKALGKELEVPQANILRAIASLEEQGIVFVMENGLRKQAKLTPKGQALAEKVKGVAVNLE